VELIAGATLTDLPEPICPSLAALLHM